MRRCRTTLNEVLGGRTVRIFQLSGLGNRGSCWVQFFVEFGHEFQGDKFVINAELILLYIVISRCLIINKNLPSLKNRFPPPWGFFLGHFWTKISCVLCSFIAGLFLHLISSHRRLSLVFQIQKFHFQNLIYVM
jgi:hypothetical protein